MKRHRYYDELRVRVKQWRGMGGSAESVCGPILEYIMAMVWARLLFPFTEHPRRYLSKA